MAITEAASVSQIVCLDSSILKYLNFIIHVSSSFIFYF